MNPLPGLPTDGSPWNPWKTLPHLGHVYVDFYADLPDGIHGLSTTAKDGTIAIALDGNLTQQERCWTIAHELIHIERGGTCHNPGHRYTWISRNKEEHRVNATACDRLIPPQWLAQAVRQTMQHDTDVPIEDLAEQFWVPAPVVMFALQRLKTVHHTHLHLLSKE